MAKYFILLILFLSSCGTTGHIVFYNFDANKYDVEKGILGVINKDSAYAVPKKWGDCNKGDYFERIYIYFKKNPEELFRIGFTDDSTVWKRSSTSRLGFVSQFNGEIWKNESDLNNVEQERIQKRLESEIFSKIMYKYYKSK